MRYLYILILPLVFSACEKEPETRCLPAPNEGIENYGFIVRDSTGQNRLLTTIKPLDPATIKVMELCTGNNGSVSVEEKGILQFDVIWIGTFGVNKPCNTMLLQWSDNDVDTLSYDVLGEPSSCKGTHYYIDSTSVRLNGDKLVRDTPAYGQYKAISTIRK